MQGHPYRSVCDLRSGAATSLVELEFASHTPAEADESARVPPGLPYYSIQARMSELDVVFLNRFLMARLLIAFVVTWHSQRTTSTLA